MWDKSLHNSFTPPGAAGYNPDTEISYDPELARQLLAEAGFESTEDFPVLQILYNTSEDHRKIALTIQQMWQQNLGISVELENIGLESLFESDKTQWIIKFQELDGLVIMRIQIPS